MVNNWSTEIESFNINFVHISGKDNVLVDTLSRLIDMDPDLKQQPELQDHEFRKYCFETLPKARGHTSHQKIGGEGMDVCEIQITYDNDENSEFSVELPLDDSKFVSLQEQDPKCGNYKIKLRRECLMSFISGSSLRPSGFSLCPKNLQSVDLNWILPGLSDRLFILAVLSRVSSLPSCWTSVSPCVSISSAIPCTPSSCLSTLSSHS